MQSSKKYKVILDTATKLFDQFGFNATGIDLIIKESGVSKATLYKYFSSKEALILSVLKEKHRKKVKDFEMVIQANLHAEEPVLAIFDVYNDLFDQENYYGCSFNKAGNEFNHQESLIYQFNHQAKAEIEQLFIKYLHNDKRNKNHVEKLAKNIMILLFGAVVDASIFKNRKAAIDVKKIAQLLLSQDQ